MGKSSHLVINEKVVTYQYKHYIYNHCHYIFKCLLKLGYKAISINYLLLYLIGILFLENAVNGEKFVHIHLRYDKDSPKGLKKKIRNASSLVLNALGIKMEGREVYVRHAALDNQENGILHFLY